MQMIPFFISGAEIAFIVFILVMVFGADKIPEIAKGLGKGMRTIKDATNDIKTAPRLTVEERRLYTAASGGPVGVLIDVLNGRMEMLKRQKEYADLELLIQQSKHLVPNNFFVETLKIDPIWIDDFLYFCSNQEEFKKTVNRKDVFVMIDFFRNQKAAYQMFKEENPE